MQLQLLHMQVFDDVDLIGHNVPNVATLVARVEVGSRNKACKRCGIATIPITAKFRRLRLMLTDSIHLHGLLWSRCAYLAATQSRDEVRGVKESSVCRHVWRVYLSTCKQTRHIEKHRNMVNTAHA